jgi:hypothetical protein
MAHTVSHSAYRQLTDRLNRFPQGAPPAELLTKILKVLFDRREAELVSLLPIRPFTAKRAAGAWRMTEKEAHKILDGLAGKALLVDFEVNGDMHYVLPPPMAGFFEFSMMRIREDIDQRLLAELFYQYLNQEEDFVRALFTEGQTQLGRAFVHEPALSEANALHVLDYERASEVVKTASHRGISMCYCRHKMMHLDRACAAPMDICMTFNTAAESLIRHGHARPVEVPEGLELLAKARENNLVQFGENVRQGVNFICNCCGCCCEAMTAARRFALMQPIHTTNFSAGGRENLQWLRQMRKFMPGGGHDPGFGQRSQTPQAESGPGGRKPLPGLRRVPAGVHPEPAAYPSSTGPIGCSHP